MKRLVRIMLLLACVAPMTMIGCATSRTIACRPMPEVKERFLRLSQSNQRAIDDHIYFSREGASGGRSFGGGGCGCN